MSTNQCLWCRYCEDGDLKTCYLEHLLIGLVDGRIGEKWLSEIQMLCRWRSWKTCESEFAGIRVRQQRDFLLEVDLEDYTNKFITEAPIMRERSKQRQAPPNS